MFIGEGDGQYTFPLLQAPIITKAIWYCFGNVVLSPGLTLSLGSSAPAASVFEYDLVKSSALCREQGVIWDHPWPVRLRRGREPLSVPPETDLGQTNIIGLPIVRKETNLMFTERERHSCCQSSTIAWVSSLTHVVGSDLGMSHFAIGFLCSPSQYVDLCLGQPLSACFVYTH